MPPKRYMVVPRTTQAQEEGVMLGNNHIEFRENGRATNHFWVDDPVKAQEIDQTAGLKGSKKVWVHEDPGYEFHLKHDGSNGHNREIHFYTFGPTETYSKAWEEFEKRRTDKKEAPDEEETDEEET